MCARRPFAVMVAPEENHTQTFAEDHNPACTGEVILPSGNLSPMPFDHRKAIVR